MQITSPLGMSIYPSEPLRTSVHIDKRVSGRAMPCSRALEYFVIHPGTHYEQMEVMKGGAGQRQTGIQG